MENYSLLTVGKDQSMFLVVSKLENDGKVPQFTVTELKMSLLGRAMFDLQQQQRTH